MYKVTIDCDTSEDAKVVIDAYRYREAFNNIWESMFRPRHKHGYDNSTINDILHRSEDANELMSCLEEIYHSISNDIIE